MDRLLNRNRHARGFSLLEILVTLAIVVFGVLGLMRLSLMTQQSRLDTLMVHRASVLSQNLIEQSLVSGALNIASMPQSSSTATASSDNLSYWVTPDATNKYLAEIYVSWLSPVTNASSTLCFAGIVINASDTYCVDKNAY
jgi:prepilin-type N-terminal cleavage/methylation domain-containing protein